MARGELFTFDITPEGGETYRIGATSRDVGMWERTYKGRSLGGIEKDAKMSDFEEIAHRAALRLGRFEGNITAWREQVDVEVMAPMMLAMEDAKADAKAAAAEAGQEWTPARDARFDRAFQRDWESDDDEEGEADPTQRAR